MIAAVAYRVDLTLLAWDIDVFRVAEVMGIRLDDASLGATATACALRRRPMAFPRSGSIIQTRPSPQGRARGPKDQIDVTAS